MSMAGFTNALRQPLTTQLISEALQSARELDTEPALESLFSASRFDRCLCSTKL